MLGGAVGDAMGFPQEGFPYYWIREHRGKVAEPRTREGVEGWKPAINGPVWTDDTVMKHMVCQAIFNSNGRVKIEAVADVWRSTINDFNEWIWWNNTRVVAAKLKYNPLLPLREVGRDSIPCNDAAMIIGPVGIVNAGDSERAAQEAWDISALWQNGYSRECAASMAAAHAAALMPDATVDFVIEKAKQYSPTMAPYIDKAMKLIADCSSMDEFTERYYESYLEFPNDDFWMGGAHRRPDWSFGADALEVCTEALAFFKMSDGNAREAIIGAINFGRDCDTIAGIAGAFCGALNGPDTVPSDWAEAVTKANPQTDVREYSQKLYELLLKNLEESRIKVTTMEAFL